MTDGFCYVVYGERARAAARDSLATLRRRNRQPVTVVGDAALDGAAFVEFNDRGVPGRWAKVNLDRLSPYGRTCYLDADTIVHGDLSPGFGMLADGWDLVVAPSVNQDGRWLEHVNAVERDATLDELGHSFLQLQAGAFYFDRQRCARLFQAWREEWERYEGQDQGALLRALYREPVRVWLLGQPWSNGEMVRHLHGKLRRKRMTASVSGADDPSKM